MKRQVAVFILFACFSCIYIGGCRSVPYSGRSQMLFTSESQEEKLGKQAWQQILSKERIEKDPQYEASLLRVGKKLATAVNMPKYKWEFKVFDSNTPNAFCLPGGKVGVYRGLFKYVDNDAELATVVGHEIAHAVARHGGERMSQSILQGIGAEVISVATNDQLLQIAYGYGTNLLAILPYSRTHESEADYMGLLFMAKAGYDPHAALKFWEKFGKLSDISMVQEFLSTHPAGKNRIKDLKEHLPEAMKLYNKAPQKLGLGEVYSKKMQTKAGVGKTSFSTNYQNSKLGFGINRYPDWTYNEDYKGVTFIAPDGGAHILVQTAGVTDSTGRERTLQMITGTLQRNLAARASNASFQKGKPTDINGLNGMAFSGSFKMKNMQIQQYNAVLKDPRGKKFYIISYYGKPEFFKKNMKAAANMIASFRAR
ncbi:M48 family metallopeptidase [Lentisphaerota bacterium ZTH]|nr:M48 family metallopeptidase [Lentisphaerota bacterium]WET06313.1 M48 family metallopeptidase [Lentisphaerota bacterium ZTH]